MSFRKYLFAGAATRASTYRTHIELWDCRDGTKKATYALTRPIELSGATEYDLINSRLSADKKRVSALATSRQTQLPCEYAES